MLDGKNTYYVYIYIKFKIRQNRSMMLEVAVIARASEILVSFFLLIAVPEI